MTTEEHPDTSFLGSNNTFFMPNTISISFGMEEEDPWSAVRFDNDDDLRAPLTQSIQVDEGMVTESITAANVLIGVDLPEIFDTAYIRAGPIGDRITTESLETVIKLGGLSPRHNEQIMSLIVPPGAMYVTRNEFNTALALIGCAQKNMDLPSPLLRNLDSFQVKKINPLISTVKPKQFDDDPWRLSSTPPSNIFPVYPDDQSKPIPTHTKNISVATKIAKDTQLNSEVITDKWFTDLDQITITIAEKEGFLFTHVNYLIQSNQRQSSVRRRYSDFFWLWEILLKRYPFRIIPHLPPKKISGKDEVFLKQRCKGLSRFINCIIRHPVLKNDEVVTTFLTEETEFLLWRKAMTPSIEEEFIRINPDIDELQGFIPKDLSSRIEHIKNTVPKSIEKYDKLGSIMEKMVNIKHARSIELRRYDSTLKELSTIEHDCFVQNCDACNHVVRGYESVGNYMHSESAIIESEIASINNVLESLQRHKDIATCFLDMLDRKVRLAVNQIDTLTKKIQQNTIKVNQNRGVPGLESEVERLDHLLKTDTEHLIYQQRRDTYIHYCVASELSYLHKQQAFISLLYQNYVRQQLQHARRTIDNYKALEALLYEMPKPEDFA
ncbi:hypothetical protein BDB01DRAFT_728559 [Pilobolus umbonatus]|nr:hypothetical protein BDB01DRAFT_728559 [Pilobolus umbonatus]